MEKNDRFCNKCGTAVVEVESPVLGYNVNTVFCRNYNKELLMDSKASPDIRHDNYLAIREWRNIIAITTGSFIAGLKSDGTVVAVYDRAIDVPDWSDWALMTR